METGKSKRHFNRNTTGESVRDARGPGCATLPSTSRPTAAGNSPPRGLVARRPGFGTDTSAAPGVGGSFLPRSRSIPGPVQRMPLGPAHSQSSKRLLCEHPWEWGKGGWFGQARATDLNQSKGTCQLRGDGDSSQGSGLCASPHGPLGRPAFTHSLSLSPGKVLPHFCRPASACNSFSLLSRSHLLQEALACPERRALAPSRPARPPLMAAPTAHRTCPTHTPHTRVTEARISKPPEVQTPNSEEALTSQ